MTRLLWAGLIRMAPDTESLGVPCRNHGAPKIHIVWIGGMRVMTTHACKQFLLSLESFCFRRKVDLRGWYAAWMCALHSNWTITQAVRLLGVASHTYRIDPP